MAFLTKMTLRDYQLQPQRIDIWQFPLTTIPQQAADLLSDDELHRAERFHFAKHKRRFTAGRAILRLILARYLQQDAAQLSFNYNQHGKPQVKNSQNLEFNLSHSGELALLAIGQQFSLGIDVEWFSAKPYEGIAEHAFSPKEIQQVKTAPPTIKPFTFFHIWAQKEAFIKASGLGLAYPTQQFEVPIFFPNNQGVLTDPLHQITWKLYTFMPRTACSAAICYQPSIETIRYNILIEDEFNHETFSTN